MERIVHKTDLGRYYIGDSVKLLQGDLGEKLKGRVQLILTSPPFPLNNKKSYGNLQGKAYRDWFTALAKTFADLITDDGSIVIEIGNSWVPGRPVQSLLHLESLIGFVENPDADLRLCQQFVCYNPTRLPSPAEWVTIRRIRVTDSYTHVWWMVSPARLFEGRLVRLNGVRGKRKEALAGLSRREEPSTDLPFEIADDAFEVGLVEDELLLGSAE